MDNLWIWLVVEVSTNLKNMSSSNGMMTIPNIWKKNANVPNHQPVMEFADLNHPHVFFKNIVEWDSNGDAGRIADFDFMECH